MRKKGESCKSKILLVNRSRRKKQGGMICRHPYIIGTKGEEKLKWGYPKKGNSNNRGVNKGSQNTGRGDRALGTSSLTTR